MSESPHLYPSFCSTTVLLPPPFSVSLFVLCTFPLSTLHHPSCISVCTAYFIYCSCIVSTLYLHHPISLFASALSISSHLFSHVSLSVPHKNTSQEGY